MKAVTTVMMIACGLIALVGLFAAGHAVDVGMTLFGFILMVFGVGMIFLYLKQHFDAADAHHAAPAGSGERVLDRVA
jgi:hypothetical protein